MAKQRSPNYPSVGLTEALSLTEKVYAEHGRDTVTREEAAQAFGYTVLSGRARLKLSAVLKFGLLEQSNGGVRVADDYMAIKLADPNSPEKLNALRRAACRFELIPELLETHGTASVGALKRHLMLEREFTEDGADTFIPAFRDTVSLAKLGQNGTVVEAEKTADEQKTPVDLLFTNPFQNMATAQKKPPEQAPPKPQGASPQAPSPGRPISVLIGFDDDGNALYGHVAFDVPIKKGYLKRLGKQLEAMEDAAERGPK